MILDDADLVIDGSLYDSLISGSGALGRLGKPATTEEGIQN